MVHDYYCYCCWRAGAAGCPSETARRLRGAREPRAWVRARADLPLSAPPQSRPGGTPHLERKNKLDC